MGVWTLQPPHARLCLYDRPGRSCHGRGKTVLFGRSCWQTCIRDSTDQVSSRTAVEYSKYHHSNQQHNLYSRGVWTVAVMVWQGYWFIANMQSRHILHILQKSTYHIFSQIFWHLKNCICGNILHTFPHIIGGNMWRFAYFRICVTHLSICHHILYIFCCISTCHGLLNSLFRCVTDKRFVRSPLCPPFAVCIRICRLHICICCIYAAYF